MVCRSERDDAKMTRAARLPDGSWYLGRGPGRGAWWCAQPECAAALSAGALSRALRTPVTSADLELLGVLTGSARRP
ncbi:MAG TPA: DUF448 domain-containing protein [Acidimicrobiales bacterium]|nr:DUF448 domain-containing protein [Acidimicrobiales bacterium]